LEEEIDVGRDSCIPSSFRREQQFNEYLLPTTIRLGICPTSDICPLALHHRESHTLARSRQAHSVTHRKDYKPFQIGWSKSAPEYSVTNLFAPKRIETYKNWLLAT